MEHELRKVGTRTNPRPNFADAYGPKRGYWSTDITNGYDKAAYRQRITHFTEELPFLSEEDRDWVMGKSILERPMWE
jgi:hypothetical protein